MTRTAVNAPMPSLYRGWSPRYLTRTAVDATIPYVYHGDAPSTHIYGGTALVPQ